MRESEIIVVHNILALGRITLFWFQSLIPSPANGKSSNHLWNRGEDFENKKAEQARMRFEFKKIGEKILNRILK